MTVDSKYFATPAMQAKGSVIIEQEFTVTKFNKTENTAKFQACPKNENNDGWLQMWITKHGEKRDTQVYACLNRAQAIALRDLLNAAYGGSSRVARRIEGSAAFVPHREVK